MAIQIIGPSGYTAEVNVSKELLIAPTQIKNDAGYIISLGESDSGSIVGTPEIRPLEINVDSQLRVGQSQVTFLEYFKGTVLNSNKWQNNNATMTLSVLNGFVTLNAGNSLVSAQHNNIISYQKFSNQLSSVLYANFLCKTNNYTTANATAEIGFGYISAVAAPTDGVFLRFNQSGQAKFVLNFNGTETEQTINWIDGQLNYVIIEVGRSSVKCYINDIKEAEINLDAISSAYPILSVSFPFFSRVYNNTTVASLAKQLQISSVSITNDGVNTNESIETLMACMGHDLIQGQTGSASLTRTSNYANSAAPALATLSNTAAGYTTMGGQFSFNAVAGAETDYALFGFQVPNNGIAGWDQTAYITNIEIDTFVSTTLGASAYVLQWVLGVNSTAVSLATAQAATTKEPKIIPIGIQSFASAAVAGTQATTINKILSNSIACYPGGFIHIILKMPIGTATGAIRGTVAINGYYK